MDIAALLALRAGTTPGPWMAESGHEQSNGQLYWQVTDGSDAIMQNQFCWCQGDHAANARLIAAAPDMLDAIAALQAEVVALTARAEAKVVADVLFRPKIFDVMVEAAEDAAGKDVSFNVVVGRSIRAALREIGGKP